MENLSHLELVKELRRRADTRDPIPLDLDARITRAVPGIDRLLRQISRYHAHFTDHSIDHSARIIRNIGCVLRPEQLRRDIGRDAAISSIDLYLIIAAALVHDIGMVVADDEVLQFLSSDTAADLRARHARPDDWCWHGVSRLALAEVIRRNHPQRSLKMILEHKFIPSSLHEDAPILAKFLGLVASGHGVEFEDICDRSKFPIRAEVQIGGPLQEECNPRFVAACLRLGDLLDIGTARVCPILRGLSEPLGATSQAHWDQYQDIVVEGLQPASDIVIRGTCPTQEAERVLREWVSWLEGEAGNALQLLNTGEERYRLSLGRVRYDVAPKQVNGKPVYEFLEFRLNLDERRVFERLFGKALYGRTELAIRELIQNAIDAQRARILYELTTEQDWDLLGETEQQAKYAERIGARREQMPIRVSVRTQEEAGAERCVLMVSDSGIGMGRDTISNYLLKVGRSRWMNDSLTARLGIGTKTIGTFGIGFVSTLMIADRITVDTKSCLPSESPLAVTVYGWQGYAATSPGTRTEAGTTISLVLSTPELAATETLSTVLAQQLPLIDFPIQIVRAGMQQAAPRVMIGLSAEQSTYAFGTCGSTITLRKMANEVPHTRWEPECSAILTCGLCQDGIAVSDVRAPSMDWTWARVLSRLGVLLDLRGRSRVSLDLSRNLVEGGVDAFWSQIVPECWSAIIQACPSDTNARRAVLLLAETLYVETHAPILFVRADKTLAEDIAEIGEDRALLCLDPTSDEWGRVGDAAVWLCPPTAYFDAALVEGMQGERRMLPVSDVAGVLRNSDLVQRTGAGSPENEDDEDEVPELRTALDRYHVRGKELAEYEAEEGRRGLFTGNMLAVWRRILRKYEWVVVERQSVRLLRDSVSGAQRWDSLLSFPVTPNWRSFALLGGVIISSTQAFAELCGDARQGGLSYADLLVFISCNFGGSGWKTESTVLNGKLSGVPKVIDGRRIKGKFGLNETEEDDRYGGEEDGILLLREEDLILYNGIAAEFGLESAVAQGDTWPASSGMAARGPYRRSRA